MFHRRPLTSAEAAEVNDQVAHSQVNPASRSPWAYIVRACAVESGKPPPPPPEGFKEGLHIGLVCTLR